MNADEIAALQALTRNLGWKILMREFQRRIEDANGFIMSTGTDPMERHHEVQRVSALREVLDWPGKEVDRHRAAQGPQIHRAGVGAVAREE